LNIPILVDADHMSTEKSTILDDPTEDTLSPVITRIDRIARLALFISIATLIIGILFKLQHWEGSAQLLIVSLSAISFTGVVRQFIQPKKDPGHYLLMMVFALLPIGYLFSIMHWAGANQILLPGIIALLGYVLYYGWKWFTKTR
jgi:hypothetical protein